MKERYLNTHLMQKDYHGEGRFFENGKGWQDVTVGDSMVFSHRRNRYTKETFTEGMHAHDYYELLIYMGGDVEYFCENTRIRPTPATVLWFAPGEMHTARLCAPSLYERYVLYFTPDFFRLGEGAPTPITDFMRDTAMTLSEEGAATLRSALQNAEEAAAVTAPHGELLLHASLVQIFGILQKNRHAAAKGDDCADTLMQVKQYMDTAYGEILSVGDIAPLFGYSREHLTRLFKERFNISPSRYLQNRRISASLSLLPHMKVADAAYAVGFRSQSAFIAAFRKNIGCLPARYRGEHLKNKGMAKNSIDKRPER